MSKPKNGMSTVAATIDHTGVMIKNKFFNATVCVSSRIIITRGCNYSIRETYRNTLRAHAKESATYITSDHTNNRH